MLPPILFFSIVDLRLLDIARNWRSVGRRPGPTAAAQPFFLQSAQTRHGDRAADASSSVLRDWIPKPVLGSRNDPGLLGTAYSGEVDPMHGQGNPALRPTSFQSGPGSGSFSGHRYESRADPAPRFAGARTASQPSVPLRHESFHSQQSSRAYVAPETRHSVDFSQDSFVQPHSSAVGQSLLLG